MATAPPLPTIRQRRLAGRLGAEAEGPVAFLESAGIQGAGDAVWAGPLDEGPGLSSPVLALLLGAHEGFSGKAHALVRRRVMTTAAPSELDRALVRVAATKITAGVVPVTEGELDEEGAWSPSAEPTLVDAGPLARRACARAGAALWSAEQLEDLAPAGRERASAIARELASVGPHRAGPLPTRDRPVAALLLDEAGQPLAGAYSLNGTNRVLHAEVALILGLRERGIPLGPGARVLVTLAPCRMCAALLVAVTGGEIEVGFLDPDPGRLARGTMLQARGAQRRWPAPEEGITERERAADTGERDERGEDVG